MFTKSVRVFLVCFAVAGLTACGTEEGFQQVRWNAAEESNDQIARLRDLSSTTERNMPTTGSASYAGHAVMRMDRSPFTDFDNIAIIADASMTAEFSGTGTFSGSITNFEAVTSAGTDTQTLVPASGEILIGQDESLIGTGTFNNALAADYAGGFTVDGTSYTVDGVIIGQFIGNRTSDPTPAGITKGVVGGNTTLSTQYAVTDTGSLTAFELIVFGETVR